MPWIQLSLTVLGIVFGMVSAGPAAEHDSLTRSDSFKVFGGGTVTVPGGKRAFASQVVSFAPGSPSPMTQADDPTRLLGPPDCAAEADGNHFTLGCGGEVVLSFPDHEILDGPGADILIVEVGDAVEGVDVAVSRDMETWIAAGSAKGGVFALDLGQSREESPEAWRLLRLRDRGDRCMGPLPGADIDAVAAFGMPRPNPIPPTAVPVPKAAQQATRAANVAKDGPPANDAATATSEGSANAGARVLKAGAPAEPAKPRGARLAASVLFDFDRWDLKPEGRAAVLAVVRKLPAEGKGILVVQGYADAKGAEDYNLVLSGRRAEAVAEFLRGQGLSGLEIRTESFGESRPVADNESEEGRARNRRVELEMSSDGK